MCLTGNKGWVEACGDTLAHAAHTHGINGRKTLYSVVVGSHTSIKQYLVRVRAFVPRKCLQCLSVCVWLLLMQLCDQAQTGSSMWVNCDLAISLPGGDKS